MRRCAHLLSIPLAATGSLLAHCVAFRLLEPAAHGHAHGAHDAAPGWFTYDTGVFAAALGLVVAAVALFALDAYRGRAPRLAPPPWIFAAVPPTGFLLQEHLERLVRDGSLGLHAFVEPTFFVGLWLQIPFAAAAFLLARALLRIAERVGTALARARYARRVEKLADALLPLSADSPRVSVLARGRTERGPPFLLPSG